MGLVSIYKGTLYAVSKLKCFREQAQSCKRGTKGSAGRSLGHSIAKTRKLWYSVLFNSSLLCGEVLKYIAISNAISNIAHDLPQLAPHRGLSLNIPKLLIAI